MSENAALKRVVLLGADFSPSSLPPALRLRLFAQHLPEFGWQPTVITTDPRYYDWQVDPENENLLPPGFEVVRTKAFPKDVTRRFGIGDIGMRSMWHHWRALQRIRRLGRVDLLFIPVPPYVPAILGRLAHDFLGIPYVIDYIDPWVNDYYATVPVHERPGTWKWAWSNRLARLLEPFALRHAAQVTTVSSSYLEDATTRYPWLSRDAISGIPYGGEPADAEYVRTHPRPNRIFNPIDGDLHLSYVGRGGVDMLPVLRVLFTAIQQGLTLQPDVFHRLRVHFVGTTYDPRGENAYQVMPLVREMGLEGVVDEHPVRVSYLDAFQILMDSHGLVAVGSELPYYTASKIFPFILSRRPLLAIFHECSSVVSILKETQAGTTVAFTDIVDLEGRVDEVTAALAELLRFPTGYEPPVDWDAFNSYSARAMSQSLAQVLDRAIAGRMS